ncbi:MAG: type III pantothenate kinase [Rhodothermales bacterium]
MWLVFDVGNSSIKGGLFDGSRLDRTFDLTHDAAAERLDTVLDGREIECAGIASVVPGSAERLSRLLSSRDLHVTEVRHTMHLPFEMAYRTPETLGTDRIAAAAAAWVLYGGEGRNVVAIDAGTAFTCEVIDRHGVYHGGTIGPGPALMQRALHSETAQLPDVPLEVPDSPVGRSTVEAMQAGVMYGFIDSVQGLLRRIRRTLDGETVVVATGGWSRILCDHLEGVEAADAHLVLRGVRILMSLNG